MLRVVQGKRVEVNGVAMTPAELDAIRPNHGLSLPSTHKVCEYKPGSGVRVVNDGFNQFAVVGNWAAAEALLNDSNIASDLETLRNNPVLEQPSSDELIERARSLYKSVKAHNPDRMLPNALGNVIAKINSQEITTLPGLSHHIHWIEQPSEDQP